MKQETVDEINRRFTLMTENVDTTKFDIPFGRTGSLVRFCSGLFLVGEGMDEKYTWMDELYVNPCLTLEEFHGNEYDDLLTDLHKELLAMQPDFKNTFV